MKQVLVAGVGGFIGGHVAKRLLEEGHSVVGVDIKPVTEWYQTDERMEIVPEADLKHPKVCVRACRGVDEVVMLAADMGGIGFITNNKLDCQLSVLVSTNMLLAAANADVERYFYSSSACVYPSYRQDTTKVTALKESDAYPSSPESGYGSEKLFTEEMCKLFREERGLETRIARYHNVFGPQGTWSGGREKAPAAICRKVIEAKESGVKEIEIWGDGNATRSYMYIDDCVEGTLRIMRGDYTEPLNLGSDRLISVNDLVSIVEKIAGIKLKRRYDLTAPQGVRGRNSDNTLLAEKVGWVPQVSLEDGLERTYRSIYDEMLGYTKCSL